TMGQVLPGKPIDDIALGDSVMHVLFNIEQKDLTFIPGSRHLRRGPVGSVVIQQPAGSAPAWRHMDDDKGHLVVASNFDTDVAAGNFMGSSRRPGPFWPENPWQP